MDILGVIYEISKEPTPVLGVELRVYNAEDYYQGVVTLSRFFEREHPAMKLMQY